MNKRTIHLYFRHFDKETMVSFFHEYSEFEVLSMHESGLTITDSDPYDEGDVNHLREKTLEEFYVDFTAFIEPDLPGFDPAPIVEVLPRLNPGVYDLSGIIPRIVLMDLDEARAFLRDYFYNQFGTETIQTLLGFIEADMNASRAAKALFLHRNTLNYRLDHFIRTTSIDVRTFRGAYAIHLLYKA